MWFALFDQEHLRDELLEDPKFYKIGLKSNIAFLTNVLDLSFGRWRFWRWIFYGICQTIMLQIIGCYSLEGAAAIYDLDG